jgi:Polyketide cyclase / dehydrase and lipid transport
MKIPLHIIVLFVLLCGLFAGCASISKISSSEKNLPTASYEIAVTRHVFIAHDPSKVFDFITAEDVLPKVLTGYAFLPAVVATSGNTGAWDVPGSQRTVHLADKTTALEQVKLFERPTRFAYRVTNFTHPILKNLSNGARGEWLFKPVEGGVDVSWTYTFEAKNAVAALPLSSVARLLWQGYMDVCLENAIRQLGQISTQPEVVKTSLRQ